MISRNHPLPLYYQLMEGLRRRIEEGEWKPGDLIPSERELSETYGISRMTVRQALAELVNDGLLRRDQGRGTFVAKPKIRKQLSRLTSFTEDMRARGKQASAQVLRLEIVPARPKVADVLQIEVEQRVVLVERLRLADGEPVGIERSHLSFNGCEILLQEDLSGSLYQVLSQRFGLIPTQAQEEIEASACGPREAQVLGIQENEPVLLIRRRTLDQDGHPFEYVESTYRGDNYIFSVELIAGEHTAS
ncbi:MAG: GntR family transcriptional regulator [Anaerolineae bacterium]|jgi:GntR family transcriptional regulator|nr:GntR family transcriptional regulator [Anaerolineae bacterium]